MIAEETAVRKASPVEHDKVPGRYQGWKYLLSGIFRALTAFPSWLYCPSFACRPYQGGQVILAFGCFFKSDNGMA